MDIGTLSNLVNKSLEENHLDDYFLIDIKIINKKIEIYLDSDDQVTFETCRKISRQLEEVLDEKKWFGESYVLEVSSAGIGKPLKIPRQFKKNVGRNIVLKIDGEKFSGVLTQADNEGVKIEWEEKVKEGKKNKIISKEKNFQYSEILEAKIKISFNR